VITEEQIRAAISKARQEYIKSEAEIPQQFNIQVENHYGEERFRCEFVEKEGSWGDCTTWLSGKEEVVRLFFTLDTDLVNLESWTDDLTEYYDEDDVMGWAGEIPEWAKKNVEQK